jgi:flagellar hook-length control protein FliK
LHAVPEGGVPARGTLGSFLQPAAESTTATKAKAPSKKPSSSGATTERAETPAQAAGWNAGVCPALVMSSAEPAVSAATVPTQTFDKSVLVKSLKAEASQVVPVPDNGRPIRSSSLKRAASQPAPAADSAQRVASGLRAPGASEPAPSAGIVRPMGLSLSRPAVSEAAALVENVQSVRPDRPKLVGPQARVAASPLPQVVHGRGLAERAAVSGSAGVAGPGKEAPSPVATTAASVWQTAETAVGQPETTDTVPPKTGKSRQTVGATKPADHAAAERRVGGEGPINARSAFRLPFEGSVRGGAEPANGRVSAVEQHPQGEQGQIRENTKSSGQASRLSGPEMDKTGTQAVSVHRTQSVARSLAAAPASVGGREGRSVEVNGPAATQPTPVISDIGRAGVALPISPGQTWAQGGSGQATAENLGQSIGGQILDSVQTSLVRGQQEVEIRLNPPELGSVVVRFQERDEQIHGVLEVSRSDTRNEVVQALPEVLRGLQELGIQVRRFDVTLGDLANKDFSGEHMQQGGQPHQQSPGQYADQPQQPPGRAWPSAGAQSQDGAEHLERGAVTMHVPAGRIDMLA